MLSLIKTATLADLESLVNLRYWLKDETPYLPYNNSHWLADSRILKKGKKTKEFILLAYENINDNIPIGYLMLQNSNELPNINFYNLTGLISLGIKEDYKGRGFASNLLDLAIKEAISLGYDSLFCTIQEENKPSINFFTKKNFIKSNTEVKDFGYIWRRSLCDQH